MFLQNQLWVQTVQVTQQERGPIAAQFVVALNEVIDRQAERTAALRNTIPGIVYWISLMIASVGLGFLAFSRAVQKSSGRWSISILALLFSGVFTLIHDLDYPRAGTIVVSQESMRTLKQSLNQVP